MPSTLALELVDRAEDVEDQPPGGRGGVDLLLEDHQADARVGPGLPAGDIYKRPSSRPSVSDTDLDEPVMADSVDQILDSMIIREAMDSLSPGHAEVLRLIQEEGLTPSQIAERLDLPPGTVKSRAFHGMRALHTALIERGFHGV